MTDFIREPTEDGIHEAVIAVNIEKGADKVLELSGKSEVTQFLSQSVKTASCFRKTGKGRSC